MVSNRSLQAAVLAAIIVLAAYSWLFGGTRFERARWLEANSATRTRADMVDDLVSRYRLRGRSYVQVVNLLGPPTRTDRWPDWELTYALGPRRAWLAGNREWLLLDVDRAGRVIDYQVTHD